jgi:hypothetical protein
VFSGVQTGKRFSRTRLGDLRAHAVTVIAVLALIAQMFTSAHAALPAKPDLAAVAASLKIVFGESAVLCVQADDQGGAPTQPCDDDHHCLLCLNASHAAFALPAAPASMLALAASDAETLALAPDDPRRPRHRAAFSQARAPPKTV